ncbi:hypothetical protein [uncultured Lacinutrix sp.]|uniref:hypothetical protein n=1 Tax=uncultured Lacinutrix sp. TaxID=574032 RepID=UPI002622649A|nr:hypothetical protein [uncultured Lacinutrix sp.]
MKKILLLLILSSTIAFGQKNDNNKMLDTLYLKDRTVITGVIKKNLNSTRKIKMCKGKSRKKRGKCVKYKPVEVDSFSMFYSKLKRADGFLGFGKKELEKGYNKYYTITYSDDSKVYANLTKKGNNYDFYYYSYSDSQRDRQFIAVTKPNSRNAIVWFKPGNINEDIRNAKKTFPKCKEKLERFRKSSKKKNTSITDFIDENCE